MTSQWPRWCKGSTKDCGSFGLGSNPSRGLMKSIIVDIDNTILKNKERFKACLKKLGIRKNDLMNPKLSNKFFKLFLSNTYLHLDKPIKVAQKVINKLSENYEIIYITGRPVSMRYGTLKWLKNNNFYFNKNLCFFKPSISIIDPEFKMKILEGLKKYDIKLAIGDTPWDASAYKQHGIKTVIIYSGFFKKSAYPKNVIFVSDWKQVFKILR